MGASVKTNEIEFNFKQDPESDWIALNNVDKPSIIVPIDTVYSHIFSQVIYIIILINALECYIDILLNNNEISFKQEEYVSLYNNLDKSIANFLKLTERKGIEKNNNTWTPADGITMAIALQPEIITQYSEVNLTPILVGDARGSVVIDYNSHINNARVVKSFDKEAFKSLVSQYLSKSICRYIAKV